MAPIGKQPSPVLLELSAIPVESTAEVDSPTLVDPTGSVVELDVSSTVPEEVPSPELDDGGSAKQPAADNANVPKSKRHFMPVEASTALR